MGSSRVATIVLSYNRPKMLEVALRSIVGADEVILLDDGSDFNVLELASRELGRFPSSIVRVNEKMAVEERLKTARLGRSINWAIGASTADIITYLCDDDLFHPDWIRHVRDFFSASEDHVVRARWGLFRDWEAPGDELCPLLPSVDMTTGNFAHQRFCSTKHGMWWNETTVGVHDAWFISNAMLPRHPLGTIQKLDVLAGWRREHRYNMMNFTDQTLGYTDRARDVLAQPSLEGE